MFPVSTYPGVRSCACSENNFSPVRFEGFAMRSHAPAKADDTQKSRTSQPASRQARAGAFFIDNRPEAAVQRQLKELPNTSPRATQLKAQLDMINQSPRVLQ
jgi:hypothetical protein